MKTSTSEYTLAAVPDRQLPHPPFLVEEPADLRSILEPHINLCVLRRPVVPAAAAFVEEILLPRELTRHCLCDPADVNLEPLLHGCLPGLA